MSTERTPYKQRDVTTVIHELKVLSEEVAERLKEIMDRPIGFSLIVHEDSGLQNDPDKAFEKRLIALDLTGKLVKNNMELKSYLMMLGADYGKTKE